MIDEVEFPLLDLISAQASQSEAIVDCQTGRVLTYQTLVQGIHAVAGELREMQARTLVFLLSTSTAEFVLLYLACLAADLPVVLVDPKAPIDGLITTYKPALILAPQDFHLRDFERNTPLVTVPTYVAWQYSRAVPVHEDLCVLLPTSGSTGNPKLVRLSKNNLLSNAKAIAKYLDLGPNERAIQSLPMFYSYGLSVLNSHLVSGGAFILHTDSFVRPEFWEHFRRHECTSFAGVPYMYETLHRLRFDPSKYPSLQTLTQAGGRLKDDLISHFYRLTQQSGKRLVVMYGQTEATARISYLPPECLPEKIGSIGRAIPGGALSLRPVPGMEGVTELIYRGPNVMMGYAERMEDLALGDTQGGLLATGDLAVQDEDGYFRLVGRLNRFAKLFGRRISLEDIERILEREFQTAMAVLEGDNELEVFSEPSDSIVADAVIHFLAAHLSVPPKAISLNFLPAIPRTSNGKKNYSALKI